LSSIKVPLCDLKSLLLLKLTELVASQKRSCSQNISKNLWINEYILKAERGRFTKWKLGMADLATSMGINKELKTFSTWSTHEMGREVHLKSNNYEWCHCE
jgi:hypothetical protein